MSTNFLSLPRELRDQVYAYLLVHEEVIDFMFSINPPLYPQLLRSNQMIHGEAVKILYMYNRFSFSDLSTFHTLVEFSNQIGAQNCKFIRQIRIDFPRFHSFHLGTVSLTQRSVDLLEKLKSCYCSLRTLKLSQRSTNYAIQAFDMLERPELVTQALDLVDAHFRAISSAQDMPSSDDGSRCTGLYVSAQVEDGSLSNDLKNKMESYGWVIEVFEEMEEEEYDGSSDDNHSDEASSGDEDGVANQPESPIDNDSAV